MGKYQPLGSVLKLSGDYEQVVIYMTVMNAKQPNKIMIFITHHSYYQVQGQLLVSGAAWCDFAVRTKNDISAITRVTLDMAYMRSILP